MLVLKGVGGGVISPFRVKFIWNRYFPDVQSQRMLGAFRVNDDVQSQRVLRALRVCGDVQSQRICRAFRVTTEIGFSA